MHHTGDRALASFLIFSGRDQVLFALGGCFGCPDPAEHGSEEPGVLLSRIARVEKASWIGWGWNSCASGFEKCDSFATARRVHNNVFHRMPRPYAGTVSL